MLAYSNLDLMHRRRKVAGRKPFKVKPSPAVVPSTPAIPTRPTGPSTFAQKASKMVDASAKGAMPSESLAKGQTKVSFGRILVDMTIGTSGAARWKKKTDALFHLDGLQEEASNQISLAMSIFVQRTNVVKEVCIPSSPCRCSGYRGIPVHLLLGLVIGPSLAQGRINDPSY
jgi:hypothetical protein